MPLKFGFERLGESFVAPCGESRLNGATSGDSVEK